VFHLIFIDDIFQDGTIINEVHGGKEDDSKLGMLNKLCGTVCMGIVEINIKLVEHNTSFAKK